MRAGRILPHPMPRLAAVYLKALPHEHSEYTKKAWRQGCDRTVSGLAGTQETWARPAGSETGRRERPTINLPSATYAQACPTLTASLPASVGQIESLHPWGPVGPTDAPYRETVEALHKYHAEGVATVEMEASAMIAVGEYRGVSVSSIFTISDMLSEKDWDQGFHAEDMANGLKRTFEIALQTIAAGSDGPVKIYCGWA
jgi:Phosphorylase superfamily